MPDPFVVSTETSALREADEQERLKDTIIQRATASRKAKQRKKPTSNIVTSELLKAGMSLIGGPPTVPKLLNNAEYGPAALKGVTTAQCSSSQCTPTDRGNGWKNKKSTKVSKTAALFTAAAQLAYPPIFAPQGPPARRSTPNRRAGGLASFKKHGADAIPALPTPITAAPAKTDAAPPAAPATPTWGAVNKPTYLRGQDPGQFRQGLERFLRSVEGPANAVTGAGMAVTGTAGRAYDWLRGTSGEKSKALSTYGANLMGAGAGDFMDTFGLGGKNRAGEMGLPSRVQELNMDVARGDDENMKSLQPIANTVSTATGLVTGGGSAKSLMSAGGKMLPSVASKIPGIVSSGTALAAGMPGAVRGASNNIGTTQNASQFAFAPETLARMADPNETGPEDLTRYLKQMSPDQAAEVLAYNPKILERTTDMQLADAGLDPLKARPALMQLAADLQKPAERIGANPQMAAGAQEAAGIVAAKGAPAVAATPTAGAAPGTATPAPTLPGAAKPAPAGAPATGATPATPGATPTEPGRLPDDVLAKEMAEIHSPEFQQQLKVDPQGAAAKVEATGKELIQRYADMRIQKNPALNREQELGKLEAQLKTGNLEPENLQTMYKNFNREQNRPEGFMGYVDDFFNWFNDSSGAEKLGLLIGGTMLFGSILNGVFGDAGIGTLFAGLLGAGGVAYGTGALNPIIDAVSGYFGGGGDKGSQGAVAATPPPPTVEAKVVPGAPPAAPGGPPAGPTVPPGAKPAPAAANSAKFDPAQGFSAVQAAQPWVNSQFGTTPKETGKPRVFDSKEDAEALIADWATPSMLRGLGKPPQVTDQQMQNIVLAMPLEARQAMLQDLAQPKTQARFSMAQKKLAQLRRMLVG